MEITESNYNIFERAMEITGAEYNVMWTEAENLEGYMFDDSVLNIIEDLIMEVDRLKEANEDLIQDRDEHYELKKFNPYNEYGVSEKDFF